jgi:hypothetical protein
MVTGCTQVLRTVLCESGIYGELSIPISCKVSVWFIGFDLDVDLRNLKPH